MYKRQGGIFTAVCFGHGIFGNKAVFGNNVGHTGKGTPIAQRMLEEYRALQSAGELDMALFDESSADALRSLLEDGAERFAAANPETF